jgi:toxin HigB-1
MKITFENEDYKTLCEQSNVAQRKLGPKMAKKLRARLAELMAASSVVELCTGHPHPLKGDRAGQFALDLGKMHRLVFEPDHDPVPFKDDGGIDWSQVTQVCIVWIGDYHD